jgi:hypothetical protein
MVAALLRGPDSGDLGLDLSVTVRQGEESGFPHYGTLQ